MTEKKDERDFRTRLTHHTRNPSHAQPNMALPSHLQATLLPSEINFFAESEPITILPRYSMKKIELIGVCIFQTFITGERLAFITLGICTN